MSQITNQSSVSLSSSLIGQGSFGRVYLDTKSDNVFKQSNTFVFENNNFIIIENNIRELVFYKYMKEKFDTSSSTGALSYPKQTFTLSYFIDNPDNISIPQHLELKNNISKIYLQYHGIPLSKYKYDSIHEIKVIFSELCRTIYSLYSKGISHGDLKPSNILIKKDKIPHITIIDFGSVQFNHYFNIKQKHQRCSLLYVSPEELCDFVYSLYNDWWGVGVIMFEVLTGRTFIECLMIEYRIDLKQVKLFFECVYRLKKIDKFNPVNYLMSVFREIKQCHITKTINTYIKDEELKGLLMQLLVKDVSDRKLYIENALKSMYISKKLKVICPETTTGNIPEGTRVNDSNFGWVTIRNSPVKEKLNEHRGTTSGEIEEYISNQMNCYSFDKRKLILTILFNICSTKSDFGEELYGHTVMLIDRVYVNWNKYLLETKSTDELEGELVSIICLVITRCLFKSTINKTNIIQELCESYYDKKYTTEYILDLIHFIICMLDFELYNMSPDLIMRSKGKNVELKKIHESFIKYKIVNETTDKIYNLTSV